MIETAINHPAHYNQGGIECIQALEAAMGRDEFIGFLKGNTIKYLWRCGHKDTPIQELGKARWYLDKLMEVIQHEG